MRHSFKYLLFICLHLFKMFFILVSKISFLPFFSIYPIFSSLACTQAALIIHLSILELTLIAHRSYRICFLSPPYLYLVFMCFRSKLKNIEKGLFRLKLKKGSIRLLFKDIAPVNYQKSVQHAWNSY